MNDITYKKGLRTKGFQLNVPTSGVDQTLSLSGLAKQFDGLVLSSTTAAAPGTIVNPAQLRITLIINNDVVIDNDVALHYDFNRVTSGFPHFLPFPRQLTGQDTILLKVTNATGAAQILNVSVFYRNSY